MKKRFITVKTAIQVNGKTILVNQEVEVSEEIYLEMMREEWREDKRAQRAYRDVNRVWENYKDEKSNWLSGSPDQFKALAGTGELLSLLKMGLPLSLDRISETTNFEATAQTNVEEDAEAHLLYGAFEEVLNDFSERNKLIMSLLFIEELTEREVADIVGCSQKTVNNTKKKLLPIIQEALIDWK
ncbi:sigma-70 family RNA polymerase sigma factor [Fundicoccus culcitae]|uniref:Sigma-70 family RNA polymerase sigma factor n=1 Tax=Fundicoccus culcitae TaxID=2969821 RepID=A0ABY5P8Z4_9LACT|nr:sigma-70 family RNA polymerase sigma factor [Fundicoccus culcitae]UUX34893.1 sigma-70 family RNA polymerase sigma factor [Fundicoccus culcitae]